jgi:hypothetical protein
MLNIDLHTGIITLKAVNLVCPKCKSEIGIDDVDLVNETGFCFDCKGDFECKDWIESSLVDPKRLHDPPAGASFQTLPNGFRVMVSTRSYWWIVFLPMACAWSAILGFFSWGFSHGEGVTRWMLFLFLIPFYGIAAVLWRDALLAMAGKVGISVEGETGRTFKGVGPIGWTRQFDWGGIKKIRVSNHYVKNWATQEQIWLEGEKSILVARGVRRDRLRYMLIALRCQQRARGKVGAEA